MRTMVIFHKKNQAKSERSDNETHPMLHELDMCNVFMILASIDTNIASAFSSPSANDVKRVGFSKDVHTLQLD
jgi:hypothetical protein